MSWHLGPPINNFTKRSRYKHRKKNMDNRTQLTELRAPYFNKKMYFWTFFIFPCQKTPTAFGKAFSDLLQRVIFSLSVLATLVEASNEWQIPGILTHLNVYAHSFHSVWETLRNAEKDTWPWSVTTNTATSALYRFSHLPISYTGLCTQVNLMATLASSSSLITRANVPRIVQYPVYVSAMLSLTDWYLTILSSSCAVPTWAGGYFSPQISTSDIFHWLNWSFSIMSSDILPHSLLSCPSSTSLCSLSLFLLNNQILPFSYIHWILITIFWF